MIPYRNIRLTESPDLAEIRSEGRKTSVGRILRGNKIVRYLNRVVRHADGTPGTLVVKVVHNDRGYCRPSTKAVVRRTLKKADRRKAPLNEA